MNMRGRLIRNLVPAACAVMVAACATEAPRPLMTPWAAGSGFGYSERRLDGQRIEVRYATPFVRTALDPDKRGDRAKRLRGLAYELALWRTAQLAMSRKFPAFSIESRHGDVKVRSYDDTPKAQRFGLAHPQGGYRFTQTPSPRFRSAWMKVKTVLVVALKRKAGSGDMDAAATARRLAKKHAGAHSILIY